ncbi:MAG TPA: glycosyltransferase family 9 protein [Chlorobaculum sp.]|nr:glycosyltransferase family 9 protein [Chlorobaculum sp.]
MKPKKKKKRQFRQAFARTLQRLTKKKDGNASFSGPLNSVAILAQEKLGDSVLLTPLLRNLRKAFPKLEIHIIAFSQASARFFLSDPDVTAVHLAKKGLLRYRKEVLSRRFDLLFNTKDHPSTQFLLHSALIPARFKVGHRNEFHEGLFDRLIDQEFHSHMVFKNCALLALLGIHPTEAQCRPTLPPMPVTDALKKFLAQIENSGPIGINISAGEANRTWPEEKWTALPGRFPQYHFVVLSGPEDLEQKQRIESNCSNVIPSPSTQNLYEAGLIVGALRLLVTPDTSLIHVASGSGTPVVGLYREAPQDISRFGPFAIPCELVISASGEVGDIESESVTLAMEKLLHTIERQ